MTEHFGRSFWRPSSTRVVIALSVLKRKCGSSCIWRARNCAWESCFCNARDFIASRCAHLKLDNADHPQNESVDKNLNAEAIDVQQACPNCERRRMCGIDEAETAQQEQMNDSKKAPDDHLDHDRHRRKAKNDRLAKACRPNRARDATPPGPQHESIVKRGPMQDGLAFARRSKRQRHRGESDDPEAEAVNPRNR